MTRNTETPWANAREGDLVRFMHGAHIAEATLTFIGRSGGRTVIRVGDLTIAPRQVVEVIPKGDT